MTTDPAEEPSAEPEPAHRLRQLAVVALIFDDGRWQIEEDPVAILDPTGEVVCEHEGHVFSPRDRDDCGRLKERARAATLPNRREAADAFERAAQHPSRFRSVG